jgi:excinuclease ABC subunit A
MPSVYAPCPTCAGARYNPETLKIQYRGKSIADVLGMTVNEAVSFLADPPAGRRSLALLEEIGLGYLRLGQRATELSGGEAQRIKLANELQRAERGSGLYVLDEPSTGLHAADVDRLMGHLRALVATGNTVVIIEHDMRVAAGCDWLVELGPGAGANGGRLVECGMPTEVARRGRARSAPYLKAENPANLAAARPGSSSAHR